MTVTEPAALEASPDAPVWTLGDRLAKARRHAGIRQQADMAERLTTEIGEHVSKATVSAWERDVNEPTKFLATINAWSSITGVDAEWILGFRNRCFSQVIDQGQMHLLELNESGTWTAYNDRAQLEAVPAGV